jgi:hypothetical protein
MGPLGHQEKAVARVWKPADHNHGPGSQAAYGSDQFLTLTDHVAETAQHMGRISQAGVNLPVRLMGRTIPWPWLALGNKLAK